MSRDMLQARSGDLANELQLMILAVPAEMTVIADLVIGSSRPVGRPTYCCAH